MKFVTVFGFKVFSDELIKIPINDTYCHVLSTISPNSYGITTKNPQLKEALQNADYLVLDGVYFALSSILLQGKNIKKNQGPDVFMHFMHRMNEINGKVFFLGSTKNVLNRIKKRSLSEFPRVTVKTYSPPFKKEFSPEDNKKMIKTINLFNPDVLFVGLTCPKQEIWSYRHRKQLNAKLVCSLGAIFDWYAGTQKYISPIWWRLRLGWLKRTIDRPEILKRYPNVFIFFWHLLLAILRLKKTQV